MNPLADRLRRRRSKHLRRRGDRHRADRDWQAAAGTYQAYLAQVPTDWAIWVQLGHALKESGDLHQAECAYARAVEIAPDEHDPFFHLGHLLKSRHQSHDAIAAYRRSYVLGGGDLVAAELGALGVAASLSDLQLISPLTAVWHSVADKMAALVAADAARDAKRWPDAATLYHKYLEMVPDDAAVWAQLAVAERHAGRLNREREAVARAIALDPFQPHALDEQARLTS